MRCDTKRAIWWDLYNKQISISCIKHMSIIFRTLQVNNWWLKNQMFLSFCEITATNFGDKNYILHTIIYHYMTSYGYIFMIIADSCMISFHFDCIMQLKKSYHIATNVCSRKVLLLLVISLTDYFPMFIQPHLINNLPNISRRRDDHVHASYSIGWYHPQIIPSKVFAAAAVVSLYCFPIKFCWYSSLLAGEKVLSPNKSWVERIR